MKLLILQRLVPVLTALALFLNSVGGMLGFGVVIPYNPDRVEVAVSGDVITDVDKIVACYNEAVKNSGFVIGRSGYEKFEISDLDYGSEDDEIKIFVDSFMNGFAKGYSQGVTYTFEVPGSGEILSSDIKSAKMSEKDGETTIVFELVDNYDALSRLCGWDDTSAENLFEEAGVEIKGGEIKTEYKDISVACVIDDSGKIVYGDWDYDSYTVVDELNITMFDMDMTMSFNMETSMAFDI